MGGVVLFLLFSPRLFLLSQISLSAWKGLSYYVQVTTGNEELTSIQNQTYHQRIKGQRPQLSPGCLASSFQNKKIFKDFQIPRCSLPSGINIQKLHPEPARRRCPCDNRCPCDFPENSHHCNLGFGNVAYEYTLCC